MTVITGVSGSGKSSLVKGILYPALNKLINGAGEKSGKFNSLAVTFIWFPQWNLWIRIRSENQPARTR